MSKLTPGDEGGSGSFKQEERSKNNTKSVKSKSSAMGSQRVSDRQKPARRVGCVGSVPTAIERNFSTIRCHCR